MPVTLLVELFSVHNRQLYYRLGVVLSVNPITTGKRLRYAGLAVLGIAILPAGLLLTARLSYRLALLLGNVLFVALLVVLLVLGVGLAAMHWGSAANRRASKKAGYTTSKKSRDGESFPPPKAPTWKTGNLAADPRRKQLGGFHTATATLTAVVPSGEVVEGTAASPHHVLAYQRAGFVQWHKKSLAMWKLMP